MINGVAMAPIEVPLCSTLLPIARPFASSKARTVLIPHGQWPASKNPSSVRKDKQIVVVVAKPEAKPIADQSNSTAAYNQRSETLSARNPKNSEPAANAQPKPASKIAVLLLRHAELAADPHSGVGQRLPVHVVDRGRQQQQAADGPSARARQLHVALSHSTIASREPRE